MRIMESGELNFLEVVWPERTAASDEIIADFVFVHGLNPENDKKHARTTWTKNGHFWPQHFLPKSLENLRVLIYGYNSAVGLARADIGISEHAFNLLLALKCEREECPSRPVIFVCHSLGGLIVKQALVHGKMAEYYSDILSATSGLVFFGTPHRGSKLLSHAQIMAKIAQAAWKKPPRAIMEALNGRTLYAQTLSAAFKELALWAPTLSFHESRSTGALGMIVDQESATLGLPTSHEVMYSVDADHSNICKFNDMGFAAYKVFILEAKRMVAEGIAKRNLERALSDISPTHLETSGDEICYSDFMRGLYTSNSGITTFESLVPDAGTCQWITKHPKYVKWVESSASRLLWISGPPGYGKSFLAAFIASWMTQSTSQIGGNTCVYRFFCDANIDGQHNALEVLRGLLHQLFSEHRDLIRHGVKMFKDMGEKLFDDPGSLWKLILLARSRISADSLAFVIDGFDECGDTRLSKQVLDRFVNVIQSSSRLPESDGVVAFKILLTSQPTVLLLRTLHSLPGARIRLEESYRNIDNDIAIVVRLRMDEIQSFKSINQEQRLTIEQHLRENAGHTFLWVSIVLRLLKESIEGSQSSLEHTLKTIPADIDEAYSNILRRIPSRYEKEARLLLHIIVAARRHLTLSEINIAMNCYVSQKESISYEKLQAKLHPNIAQVIIGYCGSILRVVRSRVLLVHATARSYLSTETLTAKATKDPWKSSISLRQSDTVLADISMQYLRMSGRPEIDLANLALFAKEQSYESSDGEGTETNGISDTEISEADVLSENRCTESGDKRSSTPKLDCCLALFPYASEFWPTHFVSSAISQHTSQWQAAMEMCMLVAEEPQDWVIWNWKSRDWLRRSPPKGLSSLMVAATMNLSKLIPHLIDLGEELLAATADGNTVLHLVAEKGQPEMLNMLLQSTCDIDLRNNKSETPLHKAICASRMDMAQILLDHGAEFECQDHTEQSGLINLAASHSTPDMVELVFRHDREIDAVDQDGNTALLNCCKRHYFPDQGPRWTEVCKMLLDAGASVNARNAEGEQALHVAISYYAPDLARLLLSYGADTNSPMPATGLLPLHSAVMTTDIVEVLLEYGAAVDAKCKGITALQFAIHVEVGSYTTVEVLLSSCADANMKDSTGSTPLHQCVLQGKEDLVKLLLTKADPNCTNDLGITSLHIAQTEAIASILLMRGANPHARTKDGRTTLHGACSENCEAVASLLVAHGAELEAKTDENQVRPIHLAAKSPQNENTLRFLLDHKVEVNSVTRDGSTALHIASKRGHLRIVEILLQSGANIAAKDGYGWSALHYMVHHGYEDCLLLLLRQEICINPTENDWKTPLHLVNNKKVAQLLLENGANVDARDLLGTPPLHYYANMHSPELVDTILEYGAEVNARDKDHATALHFAKDPHTAFVLIRSGANIDACNVNGATALDYALLRGDEEMIGFFLHLKFGIGARSRTRRAVHDVR